MVGVQEHDPRPDKRFADVLPHAFMMLHTGNLNDKYSVSSTLLVRLVRFNSNVLYLANAVAVVPMRD